MFGNRLFLFVFFARLFGSAEYGSPARLLHTPRNAFAQRVYIISNHQYAMRILPNFWDCGCLPKLNASSICLLIILDSPIKARDEAV
jgi:hypothetical protein